jgi:hypothetical protein
LVALRAGARLTDFLAGARLTAFFAGVRFLATLLTGDLLFAAAAT